MFTGVISTLKKVDSLTQVNPNFSKLVQAVGRGLEVRLEAVLDVEADEQWSYVGNKSNQCWLWHAVEHATNTVIAYVCLASVGI